jgi:cytochrome c553
MMKKVLSAVIAFGALGVFAPAAIAQDIKADATAGEKKAAMCIGCHSIPGYQASFPEIHKVPMIAGQGAKYIAAALQGYKKGDRKHPTMKAIAASLSDQDIADLGAYYESMGGASANAPAAAPQGQVAELLKKGNCVSCHGDNFGKPIDPAYPKLAGQHADYLFVALKAYKTERNPNIGRANAIMAPMATPFSQAELKQMANYLASLPSDLKTVPEARFR